MSKDWTWNNKSIYTCHWASSHSEWEREKNDYYATDPNTINDLIKNINFSKDTKIWEVSCWEWHLSKELEKNWFNVISSDLIDRWYWKWWVDFLKYKNDKYLDLNIITNPPYKYAKEFVEHSLDLIKDWNIVAMFLKLTFLEWVARKKFFEENPPKKVLVYSRRQACAKNWEFEKYSSNAVAYCWFVWEKGFKWPPIIEWI